ncbi:MAG: DUF2809 domain-containing protein [Acidobacteriota bacterium]
MPRRLKSLIVLAATIALGLAWRFLPLHLPFFAWKYGGSMLWASAVYWLLATLAPRARTITLATLASLIAIAVELSRLIDSPTLDHFRHTLAGRLLLGSIFSPRNIVAYLLAILLTALADHHLRRKS